MESQGRLPPIYIEGHMLGANASGSVTNDSVVYRGRPYSLSNAIEQVAEDVQREEVKPSRQEGLKVVQIYKLTSVYRNLPSP
jgi:hypothetical protein